MKSESWVAKSNWKTRKKTLQMARLVQAIFHLTANQVRKKVVFTREYFSAKFFKAYNELQKL